MTLPSKAPDSPGEYKLAVQVWDQSGLASEGAAVRFDVYERPKPPSLKQPESADMQQPPGTPADAAPPKSAKRGTLSGRINVNAPMRGKLQLSPVPPEIRPADGVIEIGGSKPEFSFANVPPGDYKLSFEGTVQGSTKSMSWEGLAIDKQHLLPPK